MFSFFLSFSANKRMNGRTGYFFFEGVSVGLGTTVRFYTRGPSLTTGFFFSFVSVRLRHG